MNRFNRGLAACIVMSAITLAAPSAHAGFTLAASLGVGGEVHPDAQYEATNLMIAPGWDFAGIIRPEIGVVGTLQNPSVYTHVNRSNFSSLGLELRPMVVLSLPILPVYLRLVFAALNPFNSYRTIAYGGALGFGVSFMSLGVFAELGVLPRAIDSTFNWVLEGRAGIMWKF